MRTINIQEVTNGYVVTVTEGIDQQSVVYHTWSEVEQFLSESLGDDENDPNAPDDYSNQRLGGPWATANDPLFRR